MMITPQAVLSVGLQYTFMKIAFNANANNADLAGTTATALPIAYGPTFTQGATNAARIQYAGRTRRVRIPTD